MNIIICIVLCMSLCYSISFNIEYNNCIKQHNILLFVLYYVCIKFWTVYHTTHYNMNYRSLIISFRPPFCPSEITCLEDDLSRWLNSAHASHRVWGVCGKLELSLYVWYLRSWQNFENLAEKYLWFIILFNTLRQKKVYLVCLQLPWKFLGQGSRSLITLIWDGYHRNDI